MLTPPTPQESSITPQGSVDSAVNQLLNQLQARGNNLASVGQQRLNDTNQMEYLLRDPYIGRYAPQHEMMPTPGADKALLDANIRGIPDAYTPSFRTSTRKGYLEMEPFYWN